MLDFIERTCGARRSAACIGKSEGGLGIFVGDSDGCEGAQIGRMLGLDRQVMADRAPPKATLVETPARIEPRFRSIRVRTERNVS
jgi:hypothetical protein